MPQVDFPALRSLPKKLFELIQNAPMPGLDGTPQCKATAQRIETVLENAPQLRGSLTEAGIWLLAGDLNRSHEVSQNLESAEGSYWHGIMHRRERDFWNAKYWFRKVGRHPVMDQLAQHLSSSENTKMVATSDLLSIRDLFSPTKLAGALVDSCEQALSSQPEQVPLLELICWQEWQFLFHYDWDSKIVAIPTLKN